MKLKKALPMLALCLLLCACGTVAPEPTPTPTPTPTPASSPLIIYGAGTTPAPAPVPDESADEGWKQAYAEYLPEHTSSISPRRFLLIYLDDDDIPEIADIGSAEAEGSRILNYSDGAVHETQLRRLSFSYIPRGNLLLNDEGNMGHYTASVYSIVDGQMTVIAGGTRDQTEDPPVRDENGEFHYNYTWNGASVTAEEYEAELAAVFDASHAVYSYDLYTLAYGEDGHYNDGLYTAEEIIAQLGEM